MTRKINAAFRVHNLLAAAANKHPNQPTEQVWREVFEIKEPDGLRKSFEISRCLNQLYNEMEIVERQMNETGFSKSLYKPYLEKARNAIVPHGIAASWSSYINHLSPDTILSIKFCSEIMNEEEKIVQTEVLDEVAALISDLERILAESEIPTELSALITNNIIKIKEALYSYNIIGSKALTEVVKSAYGEVLENQEMFAAAKDTEPVKVLSKVWQKVKEISDGAKTVENALSAGVGIVDKGVRILGFLEKILPP